MTLPKILGCLIISHRRQYKIFEDHDETDKLILGIEKELKKCKTDLQPTEESSTQESASNMNQRPDDQNSSFGSSHHPEDEEQGYNAHVKVLTGMIYGETVLPSTTVKEYMNDICEREDGIISMALSNEKENFVKIVRIVLDVVPHYLRKLFITKWEEKYPNEKWQSNNTSGNALVAKVAKVNNNYADKLKAGDEQQWDTTVLVYVFLYSGLSLIDQCRNPKETRIPPLRISEEIDIIRETRNEFFGHPPQMSCPSHDFTAIVDKLKSVAKNIFGADVEKEIDDIGKVPISTQSTANLGQRLEDEKNRNDQFNQSLMEVKEEVKETKKKVERIGEKVEKKFGEIQQQLMDKTMPRKLMKLHCYLSPLHHSFCLLSYIYLIKFSHAREEMAEYQGRCAPRSLTRVGWAPEVCSILFWAYSLRPL